MAVWKRALSDTWPSLGVHNRWHFIRSILLVLITLFIVRNLGGQAQMREEFLWILSTLAAIGLVGILTFVFHLIRAPVYIKWEGENKTRKLAKPKPLTNRKELVGAIYKLMESARETVLTNNILKERRRPTTPIKEFMSKVMPPTETEEDARKNYGKAYVEYHEAINALECQKTIAGESFYQPINKFLNTIHFYVLSRENEGALSYSDALNKLDEARDFVVAEIDNISQPVPDKEGSQT